MNEKFLDTFKALETELKAENTTVLDYENSLESTDQEKMKSCRIMRNYMAHNDKTFLTASNEQIKFLNEQIMNVRRKSHTVKDEMKRIKPQKSTETLKNISIMLVKYPIVPIESKSGIYLVTPEILLKHIAESKKKIEIPTKLPKYKTVQKTDRMDSIASGTYVVLDEKSNFCGILMV